MDKKDAMYIVAALALVLIIALVIKPLATGQPINTGISASSTSMSETMIATQNTSATINISTKIPTAALTINLTPTPTWNPNVVQTVAFVDPSSYGMSTNQSGPKGTRINSSLIDANMTTIATIVSSTGSSGTTNIMYIPFPYWELVYTVTPTSELTQTTFEVTPTHGSGAALSGISGSYSTVKPQFTIQVMDGDDPNRIVRTITPPGGIDLNLWTGVTSSSTYPEKTKKYASTEPTVEVTPVDPRPWTEKFFEGQRNYYFIITAQSLDSYSVEIKVPTRYIGKY